MGAATISDSGSSGGREALYTVEAVANGEHADIKWGNFGTYVGPIWDGNAEGPFPPVKAWPRNPDGSLALIVVLAV